MYKFYEYKLLMIRAHKYSYSTIITNEIHLFPCSTSLSQL